MEERDVLATASDSVLQWIPKLYGAFQDEYNLYLVMEYVPGGDLFSILDRRDPPILSEEEARFYIAEMILAISELHSMNYIHRYV
jgi:serine/threonine protein kinase